MLNINFDINIKYDVDEDMNNIFRMEQTNDVNCFDQLSVEVIERIVLFLPAKSVADFGQCSHRLNFITKNEIIWDKLMKRDYGIEFKRNYRYGLGYVLDYGFGSKSQYTTFTEIFLLMSTNSADLK